jgi:hypothetical protein
LETVVRNSQGEGFDARVEHFNGQDGMRVGPKGLDPTRLKPGEKALFLPLWEINAPENSGLIVERNFHSIVENRRPDRKLNPLR